VKKVYDLEETTIYLHLSKLHLGATASGACNVIAHGAASELRQDLTRHSEQSIANENARNRYYADMPVLIRPPSRVADNPFGNRMSAGTGERINRRLAKGGLPNAPSAELPIHSPCLTILIECLSYPLE